ncbi:MAG: hypothetical protein L0228_15315 [Planctomycetes bacterium]|nr:hypothetical protein [Planctomycetota bacterium]
MAIPKPAPPAPVARAAKPASPPASVAEDLFDEELADATKTCPSCKTKVKHDVVLCVQCGYNFRERKKQATEVAASPAPASGLRCSRCGSHDARKVNDNEFEAFKDRKETAVAIGRPLICNACGHMWEPLATLKNYFASYFRGAALFLAGAAVVGITCFVAWMVFAGSMMDADGETSVRFSPRRMATLLRANYGPSE